MFQKDENGETILSAYTGTKVVYNLGINKTSGTMTSWFNTKGQGSRMIFANEGTGQLFNVYLDANQKVNLAVINNSGVFTNVIITDETVGLNEWNFVAAKWQFNGSILTCIMYLNSKAYTANVTSFKDFTGLQTSIGSNPSGSYSLNGLIKKFSYSSSVLSESEILSMYYNNRVNYVYDSIGRMTSKTVNVGVNSFQTQYAYVPGIQTGATTNKLASIQNKGIPIAYEYDENGNIKKITQGGMEILYYYNELNELIQEDNQVLNKTVLYSYNVGGNIKSKQDILYGIPFGSQPPIIYYSYDNVWKDKLISYNGKQITYDSIGNPVTYDGYNFTWEEGRRLKSIVGNGKNISYKYNDAGIRTEKNVDGVITKYCLLGDKVVLEDNGTDKIYYTYDSHDDLISMNLNGIEYYYVRNGQGDIIGLFDKTGTQVVSYVYDSWGKVVSTTGTLASTVGVKNPYRYRGYRYDSETGLYYLQSRYYNPEWGRYINVDGYLGTPGELLSHNMFSYCDNNPINREDLDGHFWGALLAGIGAIFAIPAEVATIITVGAVILAAATIYAVVDVAVQVYRNHHITYSEVSKKDSRNKSKEYEKSKAKGTPTSNHKVVPYKPGAKNPNKGNPNSSSDLLNEDRSVKQRRYYGPNEKPDFDIDYNHQGEETHVFPHSHDWDWNLPKPRLDWEPWSPK